MFATIYLPDFYLQAALRHQPELSGKPVALIDDLEKKATIIQLNSAAIEAGIYCGMTPSQGLARSLQLIVKTRVASQEKRMQEILLHFAGTLAPFVETTGPGTTTVHFTDERNLLEKTSCVIQQLAKSEIIAQAGLGPTPDISFLAAHMAKPILQVDNAIQFLAALPIETLMIAQGVPL